MDNSVNVLLILLGLLGVALLISANVREHVKKGLPYLLVLVGISVGYFFLTGKSPTEIPGDISNFFNKPQVQKETGRRYYREPEERQ